MLFDGKRASGYLSGGCIEADMANYAEMVMRDGKPRILTYGAGSPWIDIRLTCGGSMTIMLERIDPEDSALSLLKEHFQRRRPARLFSNGYQRSVFFSDAASKALPEFQAEYSKYYLPNWRLVISGNNPASLAIAALAAQCDIEVILVVHNGPSTPPPMRGVDYLRCDPASALQRISPDSFTAVISATHDDDLDDQLLIEALTGEAFFVGALGAVHRANSRKARLKQMGVSQAAIERIVSPIGIPGCGKSAREISVSVVAQLFQNRLACQILAPISN